jgi:subtilisin family serine protease
VHGSLPNRSTEKSSSRRHAKRRPTGVSRRRKRQFTFEALEARQVMSATTPLAALYQNAGAQVQSYSSATAEGQYAQLLSEMYWQALASGGVAANIQALSIPNDPMLANQWHLINSGQAVGNPDWQPIYGTPGEDINVAPVWNMGYTGSGVSVAVIDSGVQTNHPDLAANIDLDRQYNSHTRVPNGNPTNIVANPVASHGTAVAGIIGAVANNGIGGVGVAPGVTLVPITFLDPTNPSVGNPVVDAIRFSLLNGVDITNNSWGPASATGNRVLAGPTVDEILALRDSVIFGRGGLGMINVFASGNGAGAYAQRPGFPGVGTFSQANLNGYANSRYTIAVTGVDHDGSYNNIDGTVTNYMEAGANVLVAAPTGSTSIDIANDPRVGSGIWTTDPYVLSGNRDVAGYNLPPDAVNGAEVDPTYDFLADTAYTSRMNGTSAAAPMVSGVIALMLEANPNLSWRDVQEILLRSARQNDQFGRQTNGGLGTSTQSSWIVNQVPIFHDLDLPVPNIPVDPLLRIFNPLLDPNLQGVSLQLGVNGAFYTDHYAASPSVLTNGAGYTVSQGRGVYNDVMGFGHGVVDAELAVQMALQWGTKNQTLPGELTYTTFVNYGGNAIVAIPPAQRSNDDTLNLIVPGGIGGFGPFINYWNTGTSTVPAYRGQSSIEFSVPPSNAMSIESVDVKITITGDASAALDHLRILLVSPEGTYSDLDSYRYDGAYATPFSIQDGNDGGLYFGTTTTDIGTDTGLLTWTFNTNRVWGERSNDALLYNPVTQEPIVDTLGLGNPNDTTGLLVNDALRQGWRLVLENWDAAAAFGLQGVELAWHGSPINANSQRVQGFVGIDDDGDDAFNFSRVISSNVDLDLDGQFNRLGEVVNAMDLTQEQFAANVTVTVRKTSDGSLVDQFVTGHDGNFYFDLLPDDYTITVEDPLGRATKDDGATPSQFLRHYQTEWKITEDYFRAWDHSPVLASEVFVDATGTPLAWVDGNGAQVATGMKGINFLLDPGPEALKQAEFSGKAFADVNGNGTYDGDDIYMPNITVFGDVNRNGARDAGEATALTDQQGNYNLIVPIAQGSVLNVGVVLPAGWTATKPVTAADPNPTLFTRFASFGDEFAMPDFALKPAADNAGGVGASQPGILLGVVYNDKATFGSRQSGEVGAANVTIYIDANNNGALDASETKTTTNEHGAFVFTNMTPGQKVLRMVAASPLVQTAPTPATAGRVVTLNGSSTISNIQFGIRNTALYDYGDLPLIYGATTSAQNGARHKVGGYYLGAPASNDIDAELDGIPSANANGDDLTAPVADEDGIAFGTIVPGATVQLTVQASQSGYLQGWIDWNNDGDFSDVGERVLTDEGLVAGANIETISVPAGANVAQVYARFRFGGHSSFTANVGTIFGEATFGEVEDYQLNVAVPVVPQFVGLPADSDGDGRVNGNDFLAWQRNLGRNSGATQAHGDSTGDGKVNAADLVNIKDDFGAGSPPAAAVVLAPSGDFDGDGAVNGNDFLVWQRGVGLPHPSHGAGDANHDGSTNAADIAVWKGEYGASASAATFVASASSSTASLAGTSLQTSAAASVADAAFLSDEEAVALHSLDDVRAALNGKPFSVAGEARAQRPAYRPAGQNAEAKLAEVVAQLHAADYLDRAFDDLLGSRRRQGLQAEVELLEAGDDVDCDEAFALLADHFDWTAG